MNAGEQGFLRSRYDAGLQALLSREAMGILDPVERIGLINHQWALAVGCRIPMSDFMQTAVGFKGDANRLVLESLVSCFDILSEQMVEPVGMERFHAFTRDFFLGVWERLTWDAAPGEDEETRLARAAALWAMGGLAEDEDVLPETPRRLTLYWVRPGSLDPTMATPLIRLCARTDLGALFDKYVERFKSAPTPEERDRYLLGLAEFRKPELARRLLQFALSDEVRSQDVWKPVRYLLARPVVQEEAWRFVRENWAAFKEKGGSVGAQRMIQGTRHLWRPEWRREVESFFREPANRVAAAERALAQTLEFIEIGIRFKDRQQKALADWLTRAQ